MTDRGKHNTRDVVTDREHEIGPQKAGRRQLLGALVASAATGALARRARASGGLSMRRDPNGVLHLPAGFGYRILERGGQAMDDGYRVPGRPDAMACFTLPDGKLALMRNHELPTGDARSAWGPSGPPPAEAYRPNGSGGVSRLVVDAATGARISSNLVLAGTTLNCAGGVSPWGFLTCEETTEFEHGYVFLCDPQAERVQPPTRIDAYGRFRHEAALVDPDTSIAYLTEDEMDSAFYRCVPRDPQRPREGTLQALRLLSPANADTAQAPVGTSWQIDWVDLPQELVAGPAAGPALRHVAQQRGACRIVRGEGLVQSGRCVFFTATAGGPVGRGQIFALDVDAGRLSVVAASSDPNELDMPDNLTVGPGGLLYVAEDGPDGNRLMLCTPDGRVLPFAYNGLSLSEFAGVCFSPDGRFLFVNMQEDALTLAITGPFEQLATARVQGDVPSDVPGAAALPPGLLGLTGSATVMALAALAHRRRKSD